MDTAEEAPGWDAVEQAVLTRTGARDPLHWGTGNLPGQDGLYGLHAYREPGAWLLVTLGLSELFTKQSSDAAPVGGDSN